MSLSSTPSPWDNQHFVAHFIKDGIGSDLPPSETLPGALGMFFACLAKGIGGCSWATSSAVSSDYLETQQSDRV